MEKDTFLKDSVILTFSNFLTGILGFIFSIILSKKLGAEGMGLYGLIMPIYNLLSCLICGGMIAAISKTSAIFYTNNDSLNLHSSIKSAIFFDFMWSLIIISVFFLISPAVGKYLIKDLRTLNSLKVICPALIFIAISSILKGYFYGVSKIFIPACIDIFEKAIRIIFIIVILYVFNCSTVEGSVTAAYGALAVGEFISLFFLYIFYKKTKHSFKSYSKPSIGKYQLLFNILCISFPLCLNGFLSTALSATSTLIVPRRLVSSGISYSAALSLIGKFNGMAMNISLFPIIVSVSMSTLLTPSISKYLNNKDYYAAEERIMKVLKLSFIIGIITTIICLTIPDGLAMMFYGRNDIGKYISFSSLAAPIVFTAIPTYGILNGMGKQNIILRNSLISAVEELILLYILTAIPSINIFGYGISLIATSLTTLLLNLKEIQKTLSVSPKMANIIIDILISLLIFILIILLKNIFILLFQAIVSV